MGVKPATKIENLSNGKIKVNDLIIPSIYVFSNIESIDIKLRKLYSEAPINGRLITISYSSKRDDEEEFVSILDEVEELIDRFYKKINVRETDDSAFNKMFYGITNFLYEAYGYENKQEDIYSKKTPEYIKERFINLANRLWKLGINPCEF